MTGSIRSVPADGDLVRRRMSDLGLSERSLSRRTGLGEATVRSLLYRSEVQTSLTLADLAGLARLLGIGLGQLLASDPLEVPAVEVGNARDANCNESAAADASRLAAALLGSKPLLMYPHENLAVSFEWTTDRLRAAIAVLDTGLRPVGLFVHENTMGVTIRALTEETEVVAALLQRRDHREGLRPQAARLLYRVLRGTVSATATKAEHELHFNELRNRSAITTTVGTKCSAGHVLTEQTRFSLMVDD